MITPAKQYRRFRHRITPVQARSWLYAHNHGNRSLIANRVAHYARLMAMGQWRVSEASTIAFDSLGRLRQGQHRLEAIVQSSMTIESWIIFGMRPEDAELFDTGAPWTNSDIIFQGTDTANKRRLGAIIRHLTFLVVDDFRPVKVQSSADNRLIWNAYKPHIQRACDFRPRIKTINSAPVLAAIAFASQVVESERIEAWLKTLEYGMGDTNPVSVLLHWCAENVKGEASNVMRAFPMTLSKILLHSFWLDLTGRAWSDKHRPKLPKSEDGYRHFRGLQSSLCESLTMKLIGGSQR